MSSFVFLFRPQPCHRASDKNCPTVISAPKNLFTAILKQAQPTSHVYVLPYPCKPTSRCYETQLGNLAIGKEWLEKAFALDTTKELKLNFLSDRDLEPLWKSSHPA